jgi:hypothetical protein
VLLAVGNEAHTRPELLSPALIAELADMSPGLTRLAAVTSFDYFCALPKGTKVASTGRDKGRVLISQQLSYDRCT